MTSSKTSKNPTQHPRLQKSGMTIVLIAICCLFLWSSFGLSRVSAWIPQWVLCISLVFLILQLASEISSQKPPSSPAESPGMGTYSMFSALMWIGMMLVLVWLLGITIGAALFCFSYLRWHARERWSLCIWFALALGWGVYLFFEALMQMTLYRGMLPNFLVG